MSPFWFVTKTVKNSLILPYQITIKQFTLLFKKMDKLNPKNNYLEALLKKVGLGFLTTILLLSQN